MLPIVIVMVATIVLKIELFSSRLEESVKELLKNLNIEVFSAKTEDEPSEAVKPIVRALNRELARPRESDKDRKNEDLSAKLEADPSESVKDLRKPLV